MIECFNTETFDLRIELSSNIQTFKHSNIQTFKHSNIQSFNHSNIDSPWHSRSNLDFTWKGSGWHFDEVNYHLSDIFWLDFPCVGV